jgi:hypothetical protein
VAAAAVGRAEVWASISRPRRSSIDWHWHARGMEGGGGVGIASASRRPRGADCLAGCSHSISNRTSIESASNNTRLARWYYYYICSSTPKKATCAGVTSQIWSPLNTSCSPQVQRTNHPRQMGALGTKSQGECVWLKSLGGTLACRRFSMSAVPMAGVPEGAAPRRPRTVGSGLSIETLSKCDEMSPAVRGVEHRAWQSVAAVCAWAARARPRRHTARSTPRPQRRPRPPRCRSLRRPQRPGQAFPSSIS